MFPLLLCWLFSRNMGESLEDKYLILAWEFLESLIFYIIVPIGSSEMHMSWPTWLMKLWGSACGREFLTASAPESAHQDRSLDLFWLTFWAMSIAIWAHVFRRVISLSFINRTSSSFFIGHRLFQNPLMQLKRNYRLPYHPESMLFQKDNIHWCCRT